MHAERARAFMRVVRITLLRELHARWLATALLCLLLAAFLSARVGNALDALPADRIGPRELALMQSASIQFVPALWALAYVVAPVRCTLLLANDHASGATAPLFAMGFPRRIYLFAITIAELVIASSLVVAGTAAFSLMRHSAAPLLAAANGLAWGILCIAASMTFLTALFLMVRAADQAVMAAVLLIGIPLALNLLLALRAPEWLTYSRWLTMHVPPVSTVPTQRIGVSALIYVALLSPFVAAGSSRRIGWWR